MTSLEITSFFKNGQYKDILQIDNAGSDTGPVHTVQGERAQLYIFLSQISHDSPTWIQIHREDENGKIFIGNFQVSKRGSVANILYNGEVFKRGEKLYLNSIGTVTTYIHGYVKNYS